MFHRIIVLAAALCAPLSALQQPVKTTTGPVSGVPGSTPGITAFKGIPFALPPVGERRWTAPAPPARWKSVLNARKFGPSCIQTIVEERKPWTHEFMTHGEISEDCLYLNIWTPARSASEKRPVFVYIYGGGFNEGSGAVPAYDGEGLARKGVVMVTFNYRVGILGLFVHPELTAESPHHASGNYGLLDQVAALQWIHDNIAAFGGDPARVTIAGQSAGASSVHALTASPLAKGLFQRAIEESGSSAPAAGRGGPLRLAAAEQNGVRFAEAKAARNLAALRAMTWQQITAPFGDAARGLRFSLIVDGYFLPAPVEEIFSQGKQNDVPELTGLNANDLGISSDPAQIESSRDRMRLSMAQWAANRAKTAKTPAYTYYWNHTLPGPDAATFGAFHTSEVPYALNTLYMSDRPFTADDRKIADLVSSYWVNFAATGDPNGKGLPHWPSVDEKPDATMQIGDDPRPIPVSK